jgi:O-antigen ligase
MGFGLLATVKSQADRTAQWAAIALGFSIPLSTALDNVLLVLVAVGWLASCAWRETWQATRANTVALAALGLFALLALGTLYGERNPGDASTYLGKYVDLLFVPVFAFMFRDSALRRRATYALAASLALVLAISFLIFAGMPVAKPLLGSPGNPVVFKQYLTHGILMAYGAFLFAELALTETARGRRVLWFVAAIAAAVNVLFLGQGRTGYLLLAVLAVYLGYRWMRWRGLALALALTAATVTAAALIPGPFQQRLGLAAGEQASSPISHGAQISTAQRLEFYRTSLAIIRDQPLLGVGTGGYSRAYAENAQDGKIPQSRNPHNEYLHIMVQLGLVGLAALLYLFWTHWRLAPRLASPREHHLARGLVLAIAVGCLFNSLLLDHTEGLLYAWLSGLLFAGLKSRGEQRTVNSER